jgi:hypothetical protein
MFSRFAHPCKLGLRIVSKRKFNRAATVTVTISRSEPGRRSGKSCVKPTKKLAHKQRCTRSVRAGVLTRHGKPANNSVPFSGRIGRKALKAASYVATFVATAGSNSSSRKMLRFKIVR